MTDLVRRSLLVVPILDEEAVAASWQHGADAVLLDLTNGVPESQKETARIRVKEAIGVARRGGAEVFVRITKELAYADVEASAWPGVTGVVLPEAEAAADVRGVEGVLEEMERRHGIPPGSLQIFVLLSTAKGVWNVREIIQASPRVTSVAIHESHLCRDLAIVPREDFDPFQYAKGRIVVEAIAAGRQPIGMSHPLGALPSLPSPEEVHRLAERGRNMGFKGALCPHPSWVAPCNRAFTPTEEQVQWYREVRRLFGEGVARGSASVPLDGRMLDVPVDERAKAMLALWERCQRRDAEKSAALTSAKAGP